MICHCVLPAVVMYCFGWLYLGSKCIDWSDLTELLQSQQVTSLIQSYILSIYKVIDQIREGDVLVKWIVKQNILGGIYIAMFIQVYLLYKENV